jgi:hypothetical protein
MSCRWPRRGAELRGAVMANPWAGEVAVLLDGQPHVAKLTLGALAELEAALERAVADRPGGAVRGGAVFHARRAGAAGGGAARRGLAGHGGGSAAVEIGGGPVEAARRRPSCWRGPLRCRGGGSGDRLAGLMRAGDGGGLGLRPRVLGADAGGVAADAGGGGMRAPGARGWRNWLRRFRMGKRGMGMAEVDDLAEQVAALEAMLDGAAAAWLPLLRARTGADADSLLFTGREVNSLTSGIGGGCGGPLTGWCSTG